MYYRIVYRIKSVFLGFLSLLSLMGCGDGDKVSSEVEKIPVELKVSRFDREFAAAEPLDIPVLKKAYPYLFPARYADSIWIAKLQDTVQIELLNEVVGTFPDFSETEQDLTLLFKHIKYYFPNYSIPHTVTVTSDVDYNNRIILTDSLLLIGLDNYLGADHKFYKGFPKYIAEDLDRKYIVSDVAAAFAKQVVPKPRQRNFLSRMIYFGKELYLKDRLMPTAPEAVKINYSEEQLAWAKANEQQIWRNFIEQEYLYSTENKLSQRFLDVAPFSKFGLELDNESPGRIGRFMGWQIVRAFMEKNDTNLDQLLRLSAEDIFKRSNYKPEK